MTELRGATGAGSSGWPAGQSPHGDAGQDDAVVRRTKDGWRVGSADLPDLTSAMVLADLLAAELHTMEMTRIEARPKSADAVASQPKEPAAAETSKLRATIGQLEH